MSAELERGNGEVVHVEPLLPMNVEQAQAAMTAYQELTRQLLSEEDWQGRPGQQGSFVKRRGWAKLATFYGLSTELLREQIERDEQGQAIRARAIARAIHPNGRHADGDGACAIAERRFSSEDAARKIREGRINLEHDLPATAATRAVNRAISNLIGFGQVSAEEVAAAAPALELASDEDLKAAALAVQGALPGIDGYGFAAKLIQAFEGEVPKAATRALQGLAWWTKQPSARISARAFEQEARAQEAERIHEEVSADRESEVNDA